MMTEMTGAREKPETWERICSLSVGESVPNFLGPTGVVLPTGFRGFVEMKQAQKAPCGRLDPDRQFSGRAAERTAKALSSCHYEMTEHIARS
jgi:hypothetical protein